MEDHEKTKETLIAELSALRKRVHKLEQQLTACRETPDLLAGMSANRPERKDLRTHVEFIPDFEIIEARGINISDGGICFEVDEDLPFEMRFDLNGELHMHRAHMVWCKRRPVDGYHFGFMFVPRPGMFSRERSASTPDRL